MNSVAAGQVMTWNMENLANINELSEHIEQYGYGLLETGLKAGEVEELTGLLDRILDSYRDSLSIRKRREVFAVRNLESLSPEIQEFSRSERVAAIIKPILGEDFFLVRGILFDKPFRANWSVVWHQDRMIPVHEKIETPGFSAWTRKSGVHHVQPPESVLQNMLTMRIHLDHCDEENGALIVAPGSHKQRLAADKIPETLELTGTRACPLPAGGILLMRPLILHSSHSSTRPDRRRRILHLEFSGAELPDGLRFPERE